MKTRDIQRDYDNHGVGSCCDDYPIDSVHSASCPSTDGSYRCENCDGPFVRVSREQKRCLFCGGSGQPVREF